MRLLDELADCRLSGELLERVRAAVRAEAVRVRAARRRRAVWRGCGSVAAAILLIAGLRLVQPWPPESGFAADDPVRQLDEWIAAVDESRELLLEEGGFCRGASDFDDEEAQLDELLECLETSLSIGA
jgi:hypothetical protein